MAIDPTKPSGIQPNLDAARLQRAKPVPAPEAPAKAAVESSAPAHDRVEVSAEARNLAGSTGTGGTSSLSPERLKTILERLSTGFYDQPNVLDQVAQRVLKDPEFKTE